MATCSDDVECDGGYVGNSKVSVKGIQSGVMVPPGEVSKVLKHHLTKAVQPSDDDDNAQHFHKSDSSSGTPSHGNSNDIETEFAKMTVSQSQAPVTTGHQPWLQTQQVAQGKQTKTNSQTVNNGPSSTQTNSSGTSSVLKYPHFSNVPQRLASFGSVILAVSTQLLSVAGFFLVRNAGEDATRCFHCGIGLRHWSAEDDPWVEHARFSPKCGYLLNMKGQEFVNLIQLAVQYSNTPTNSTSNQLGNSSSNATSYSLSLEPSVVKTRQDLVRENTELRSITKCMYCKRKEVSLVFLPCGHLISCEGCGQQQRICRICNSSIKGTVRTFRS